MTPPDAKAELLPCPFCGETLGLYPAYRGMGVGKPYAIDCIGCGIEFEPREGMDVVAAWNHRAPSVSAETARLGASALRDRLAVEAYHNDMAAERELREAAERFAQWAQEGPRFAKAAGCHVGITITAAAAPVSEDE